MINSNRLIFILGLLLLSLTDILVTYYYVRKYRKWQPDKPYSLIERNPLLNFLWNKLGLLFGTIIGSIIILSLIFFVANFGHISIVILLIIVIVWVLFNNFKNIKLLNKLIKKYPTGYLPEKTFGKVEGNNIKEDNDGN